MKIIKSLMEILVNIFFTIFFWLKGEQKLSKKLKTAVSLYEKDGFGKLFSLVRSWDAPYEELEKVVPKEGRILDLGCGDGLLANYLAISSPKRRIIGIELNEERVKIADKGVKNTHFIKGDILKEKYPKSSTFILAHVLHHLPSRLSQERVLVKISKMLTKGGKLIILEIDDKPISKYIFSILIDTVVVPILFPRKLLETKLFYRNSESWRVLLKKFNFDSKVRSVHQGMPFPHVLIEANKE